MKTGNIELVHGGGGRETKHLIDDIFQAHFKNPVGSFEEDAVTLSLSGKIAFTTDSFVIQPVFFPGGDIGRLAVCGTVNDLLTAGARPMYLSAGFVIQEGFPIDALDSAVRSMRITADEAGVCIVTGDTKVIERSGGEPGLIINTSGIGEVISPVSIKNAAAGDVLIVTGLIGEHQACILSQRMGIQNNIRSDVAPLKELVLTLMENNITLHGLRDITRGGLATVLNEISVLCNLRFEIIEEKLPVSDETATLLSLLGMESVYMANEGNMLIIMPEEEAIRALELIKRARYSEYAAVIGRITAEKDGPAVRMVTKIGGRRVLPPLSGDSLPRIC